MLFEIKIYSSSEWDSLSKRASEVLRNLIDRANNGGTCFPSISLIMQNMKMDKKTVQAGLKELKEAGHIKVTRTGRANSYQLAKWLMNEESTSGLIEDSRWGNNGLSHRGERPVLIEEKSPSNISVTQKEIDHSLSSEISLFNSLDIPTKAPSEKVEKYSVFSFVEFWEHYGKKEGRAKAEKSYTRINEKDREKIKTTLKGFTDKYSDLQYRPHPTTYLNGKRWQDELPSVGGSVGSSLVYTPGIPSEIAPTVYQEVMSESEIAEITKNLPWKRKN